jgi:dTMP kinase
MSKIAAFVVLEGGEGAGKTSLLGGLSSALRERHIDVLATREPGGTSEGMALRKLLLTADGMDWDPGAELLLMVAARIQHVKRVIQPALADGTVVVCDRFVGSTLAYQGAGRGLPRALIGELHDKLVGGLRPDLTVLLDVDPHLGLARSVRRLETTHHDEGKFETLKMAFHERVRTDFRRQAEEDGARTIVVDANLDYPFVLAEVIERTVAWLADRQARAS